MRNGLLHAVLSLLVALAVAGMVLGPWVGGGAQQYAENAGGWCEEHDGELHLENAFLSGGLYCELPNGEDVRMTDVEEVGPDG